MSNSANTKKLVVTEIKHNIITNENGEITAEQHNLKNTLVTKETEPAYIKIYLQDISKLNDLGRHENSILHEIFKLSQYGTNLVTLNKYYREQICKALDTTDATVRNTISKLNKTGLLVEQGTGVYMLNPKLFGYGTWPDIRGLRMKIEYTEQGKVIEVEGIGMEG